MWGSIRARLVGSKASSKRLVCVTGSSNNLHGGGSVFFWSIGQDSTVLSHPKTNKIKVYGGFYLGGAQFLSFISNHLASPCQATRFGAEENHGGTERAGGRHAHRWRDRGNDPGETIQAFVREIAQMSGQALVRTNQHIEKPRKAHRIEEAAAIQADILKEIWNMPHNIQENTSK